MNVGSGGGVWDTGIKKEEKGFSPFSFPPTHQSCCPKGAKRSSGITSSTWPWGTTDSR